MNTLFKLFCLFAALYIVWQLGRWYGRVEMMGNKIMIGTFRTEGETYNEIMLRNCLKKGYEKNQ